MPASLERKEKRRKAWAGLTSPTKAARQDNVTKEANTPNTEHPLLTHAKERKLERRGRAGHIGAEMDKKVRPAGQPADLYFPFDSAQPVQQRKSVDDQTKGRERVSLDASAAVVEHHDSTPDELNAAAKLNASTLPPTEGTSPMQPIVFHAGPEKVNFDEHNIHDYANPNFRAAHDQLAASATSQGQSIEFDLPTHDSNDPSDRDLRHVSSMESVPGIRRRRSATPFRTRRITNDGLLDFKLNPSKVGTSATQGSARGRIPLNLPISPAKPVCTSKWSTSTSSLMESEDAAADIERQERELEYKHRHTFVGTASLDDFLENLEVSASRTTTKQQVAKVFVLLASSEQLQARQAASTPQGWEFVTRIISTDTHSYADYLHQAHVKLGSVTLRKFLGLFTFNEDEAVDAMAVVEAFYAASLLDSEPAIEDGIGSKAKTFRKWIVKECMENA